MNHLAAKLLDAYDRGRQFPPLSAVDPAFQVCRPFNEHTPGKCTSRLDEGGIIQRHQCLQRRIGTDTP